MSTTNHGNGGMTNSHHTTSAGFEETDFNWRLVLLTLPFSVLILVGFTFVCILGFRGYREEAVSVKAAQFETAELNILRAKENETLSQYKILDHEKSLVQIPVQRAMELLVNEHANTPGSEWKPITDTYLEGTAFSARLKTEYNSTPETESTPEPAK